MSLLSSSLGSCSFCMAVLPSTPHFVRHCSSSIPHPWHQLCKWVHGMWSVYIHTTISRPEFFSELSYSQPPTRHPTDPNLNLHLLQSRLPDSSSPSSLCLQHDSSSPLSRTRTVGTVFAWISLPSCADFSTSVVSLKPPSSLIPLSFLFKPSEYH